MTKYNRSQIMKDAWKRFRVCQTLSGQLRETFAQCLRLIWAAAKARVKAAEDAARKGIQRMHYSEYKARYADCMTVEGSYDKRTKTIEVMTKVSKSIGYAVQRAASVNGLCPHCHTYCHGDCLASR